MKANKIKRLIVSPIKAKNDKVIERIHKNLYDLSVIYEKEDVSARLAIERDLVNNILSLSRLSKKKNSELLQELHHYFNMMFFKGRMKLDSSVKSESIDLFSDLFINNEKKILDTFYEKDLQKVIMFLLLMNLSIHRVQKANEILEMYSHIFSGPYKARLITRLLYASCGAIDRRYIDEILDNAHDIYFNKCRTINSKAEYARFVFCIMYNTGWFADDFDEVIADIHSKLLGKYLDNGIALYKEFLFYNVHIDLVSEWLDSLDHDILDDGQKRIIQSVAEFCEDRTSGRVPIVDHTEKYAFDPDDPFYKRYVVFQNLTDKDYSRGQLKDDVRSAMDEFKEKCNSSDDLEFRFRCATAYYSLKMQYSSIAFWDAYTKNYRKVAAENESAGDKVLFFVNEYSLVNGSVAFPLLLAAKKKGLNCYCTSPRIPLDSCPAEDEFNALYGNIAGDQDNRFYPLKDVEYDAVDIKNKSIIVHGMNVYQPIFEFVTRYQFTYDYHYENDAWARCRTHMLMRTYDRLFNYIEEIERWAVKNGKQVYFLSNAPHIHNASAFRIYCEEKGYKNGLNFICVSPGYDNYFANSSDPKAETVTAVNLTKNLECRNSFLGTKDGFNRYYENNRYRIEEIRDKMSRHLSAQRGRDMDASLSVTKKEILDRIVEAKNAGKKILLLNGKVIIDLAVKYTQGVVHGDMSEWITHAVDFAGRNGDKVLLIIKPHPHENRADLTLTSEKIDDLRSIIKTDLNENTIYLDNDMFRITELVPYMDLGMVWNGTSSLEFASQGKKTLIGDVWGHYDYPIGFVKPSTLEEYESYMLDPESMNEPEDLSDRAIAFLEYMGSDDVRVVNKYSSTTAMNFHQFDSTVNGSAVDEYIKYGDGPVDDLITSVL